MATFDVSGGSASWRLSAKPEVKLAALLEISNNLAQTLSVERNPAEAAGQPVQDLRAGRSRLRRDAAQGRRPLVPVAVKSRRPGDEERMRISRTIVEEAMKSQQGDPLGRCRQRRAVRHGPKHRRFFDPLDDLRPMIGTDGEPIGVIQIDTLNQRARFTDEDLEVLAGVASQAAVAIDNAKMHEQVVAQRAMQRDLELARRMQRALLPLEAAAGARLLFLRLSTRPRGKSAATTTTTCRCPAGALP